MCKCEICGSENVMVVDDTDVDDDFELLLCIDCYKRTFGNTPLDCSSMYT